MNSYKDKYGTSLPALSTSPYLLPVYIWSLIKEDFNALGVEVSESYPIKAISGSKICWRIINRHPGTGPTGQKQATKPQLTNYLGVDSSGNLLAEYSQEHSIDFEFGVFSYSNAEADDLAWMLERLVVLCEGALQKACEGLVIKFTQQTIDMSLQERHEDDVIARYIRFTSVIPIREVRTETELRFIQKYMAMGANLTSTDFTRTSGCKEFYIPVEDNQVITGINHVILFTGGPQVLKPVLDYNVYSDQNNVRYISWNDGKGCTPNIGDCFKVDYTIGNLAVVSVPRPRI